jgi:hypothetical protein
VLVVLNVVVVVLSEQKVEEDDREESGRMGDLLRAGGAGDGKDDGPPLTTVYFDV